MRALLQLPTGAPPVPLMNARLASSVDYDEAWLQQLLFEHPELLPLEVIDPGAGPFIPVCRELAMPRAGGSVFLDLFGITAAGRPVLVECKLWRNPQARREVVAQLLEYAALLKGWSFADLTARLKARLDTDSANPLFDAVAQGRNDLDEARFVDAVSGRLAVGDFDLVVAGDGIRSDMHAIAAFLGSAGGLMARFALVEFQVWHDHAGTTVVLPMVPCRTEVIEHRVLIGPGGQPLTVEAAIDEGDELPDRDPEKERKNAINRAFWDRLIASIRFSHPDQAPPRHGGRNWVRVPLPDLPLRMTLYRMADKVGAFVTFTGDARDEDLERFESDRVALECEVGEQLKFSKPPDSQEFQISARKPIDTLDPATVDAQLDWLCRVGDRFVTAVRARF
jgi:hypothetical protein